MELMIESSNRELKESSSRVDEEKGRDWYREEPSFIPLVLTVVQRVQKAQKLWPYQCFDHLVVVDYALFKSPVNKTEFAENLCRVRLITCTRHRVLTLDYTLKTNNSPLLGVTFGIFSSMKRVRMIGNINMKALNIRVRE